jgi:hypothetical protein
MTSPVLLATLLAFAAVAAGTAIGWLLTAVAVRLLGDCRGLPAASRAFLLAQLRLLPLVAAAIIVPAQTRAFIAFEVGGSESAGMALLLTAGFGFALCVNAVRRAIAVWQHTQDIVASWRVTARPLRLAHWPRLAWEVRSPFPVVVVVGFMRPKLFVARQVVEVCTSRELAAIVEHEAAHVAAFDNLVRILFQLTPAAGLCRSIAEPLERAWIAAAEEAADRSASEAASGLELASALTKVAALVSGARAPMIPVSALIGGSELSSRVHRLLDTPPPARRHAATWLPVAASLSVAALLHWAPISAALHDWFELLVRH